MSERGKVAFVTLATNDTYSLGCLVLGNSLRRVNTSAELVVMVTTGVSNSMRTQLAQVFNVIQEVNVLDSNDPINLSLLGRPDLNVTFTKLHCWRLTQYDKAVFLDADTLVLQNVDELFDREELSAAPDAGWPDCFNSGVFVYKPSLETYQSLLQCATSQGSFDGGDQGLLNMFYNTWSTDDISKHLPFTYNVVSQAFYSYLPAFTQFKDRVKIVHFIGAVKPWHHTYDTNTNTVTPLPGTGHSQEFLQVWWNIFMQTVQPSLDPSLRKEKQLLPTVVVSHPCSNKRTYVYVPKSNMKMNPVEKEAPWTWSKGPWYSFIQSPVHYCKLAYQRISRCWNNKTNQNCKAEELTMVGLVGELASMTIQTQQFGPGESLSDAQRKLNWERGQIDYLGQDSFENIQKKIDATMSSESSVPVSTSNPFTPSTDTTAAVVKPKQPEVTTAKKETKVSSGISISLSSTKK